MYFREKNKKIWAFKIPLFYCVLFFFEIAVILFDTVIYNYNYIWFIIKVHIKTLIYHCSFLQQGVVQSYCIISIPEEFEDWEISSWSFWFVLAPKVKESRVFRYLLPLETLFIVILIGVDDDSTLEAPPLVW